MLETLQPFLFPFQMLYVASVVSSAVNLLVALFPFRGMYCCVRRLRASHLCSQAFENGVGVSSFGAVASSNRVMVEGSKLMRCFFRHGRFLFLSFALPPP